MPPLKFFVHVARMMCHSLQLFNQIVLFTSLSTCSICLYLCALLPFILCASLTWSFRDNLMECADDMGLGKTLQVLATSWALMNAKDPTGRPIVRKMLIVSPSSVCKNWGKEIKKWIGAFHGECHRVLMPGKSATNLV
jgi:hypothetical protein